LDRFEPFLQTRLLEHHVFRRTGQGGKLADGDQLVTFNIVERQSETVAAGAHQADVRPGFGGQSKNLQGIGDPKSALPSSHILVAGQLSGRSVVEEPRDTELLAENQREGLNPVGNRCLPATKRSLTER
jgi:hypothetical protein